MLSCLGVLFSLTWGILNLCGSRAVFDLRAFRVLFCQRWAVSGSRIGPSESEGLSWPPGDGDRYTLIALHIPPQATDAAFSGIRRTDAQAGCHIRFKM